ncbi:MAG TPA: tRNA (adenosine(37)-N6)-threonylcarbamoyltransferase complex dimerization subunit type 1 TsaB [Stellaceae bacterium]|nr:tRNA (adenosine(37)-N6)-threonylcarbamoyltransferase complex dimerization subunit type 1 TsaB [Stellaceae bacterium]
MKVLAFDSSGGGCSVAVLGGERVLAAESAPMLRGQAEHLVPMIARGMAAAGLGFGALDLIAVTLGPGAFTGVRIGIATAQGLALATGVPALGLGSFEAVAAAVPAALLEGRALLVAIESRRDELFLQAFDSRRAPLGEGALVAAEQWPACAPAGPLILAGDGAERLRPALQGRDIAMAPGTGPIDPAALARLAAMRWQAGLRTERLEPRYLHAPDVTVAKAGAT